MNRQLIEKYVAGKLSQEDFETLKSSIAQELSAIETELKALQDEQATMELFMGQAETEVIELAKTWKESGIRQRQEIQSAIWPEGLRIRLLWASLNRPTTR